MKLLVQPDDGVAPLVQAIDRAKRSVEILIFRMDRADIEHALMSAVDRGVAVQALIAHTNRGGEPNLRALEMRLLGAGVTVARTADHLERYHGKLVLIDRCQLLLLAFNFTHSDIGETRSFGIVTEDRNTVREAARLFEADSRRQAYSAGLNTFLVSPENAREQLSAFIQGARRELLIYDPGINDPAIIRLLDERSRTGVAVHVIGKIDKRARPCSQIAVRAMPVMRLHARMIVRDSSQAFLGSQGLRTEELDARREVGIIFRKPSIASRLKRIFHSDWNLAEDGQPEAECQEPPPASKVAKKVAKTVAKNLPPLAPVLERAVMEVTGSKMDIELDTRELEETVKGAVKRAVKEVVRNAVQEVVEPEPKG